MPNKKHHIDMFGNNYEQTYSTWEIIKALQDKNNALCSENARLEQKNDKLEHELHVTKYHLKRVESAARSSDVIHRRELGKERCDCQPI